jgi:uncharacterized membrane protein
MAAGVGTSLFMAVLGVRSSRLPASDANAVMTAAGGAAAMVTGVSVALLWATGLAMVFLTDGIAAAGGPWFSAKILLVVVLTVLLGLIHRQTGRIGRGVEIEKSVRAVESLSKASLIISLAIVALAVTAFR